MMRHWTKFPGRPHGRFRSDGPRVTMGRDGTIYMNKFAWEDFGRPAAVAMMFDKPNRIIGLIPTDPQMSDAFPVKDKKKTSSKVISASAFCAHFLIKMMRTALFNRVEIDDDGIMNLYLDEITAITRGAR